ncbi:MAG TPA: HAD domain-containing protein [Thermoleophilaceae bacterium]|nr:HAD domain-containing protein [Thermoleophilaceae bacterium]
MTNQTKPILFLDVDGVISLFGFAPSIPALPGPIHWIDGVAHCIPGDVGERVTRLADHFDIVWATGWEQRANEHLPFLLGLPFGDLPCLTFGGRAVFGSAHWKLDAIQEYAGDRPAAWLDDSVDDTCHAWADKREAPTLIVVTKSAEGLQDEHVEQLVAWAGKLPQAARS